VGGVRPSPIGRRWDMGRASDERCARIGGLLRCAPALWDELSLRHASRWPHAASPASAHVRLSPRRHSFWAAVRHSQCWFGKHPLQGQRDAAQPLAVETPSARATPQCESCPAVRCSSGRHSSVSRVLVPLSCAPPNDRFAPARAFVQRPRPGLQAGVGRIGIAPSCTASKPMQSPCVAPLSEAHLVVATQHLNLACRTSFWRHSVPFSQASLPRHAPPARTSQLLPRGIKASRMIGHDTRPTCHAATHGMAIGSHALTVTKASLFHSGLHVAKAVRRCVRGLITIGTILPSCHVARTSLKTHSEPEFRVSVLHAFATTTAGVTHGCHMLCGTHMSITFASDLSTAGCNVQSSHHAGMVWKPLCMFRWLVLPTTARVPQNPTTITQSNFQPNTMLDPIRPTGLEHKNTPMKPLHGDRK
jgi:hypothetical protein